MSDLNEMSRGQLEFVAETFGLEVDGRWNDNTLMAKLIEAGVTKDQIEGAANVLGEPESSDALEMFKKDDDSGKPKKVILRMDRPNQSFSILGYKFTKSHPYVPMPEDDALWIINMEKGFSLAHATEAAEFYRKNK